MMNRDKLLEGIVNEQTEPTYHNTYEDVRAEYIKEYGKRQWQAQYLKDLGYRDTSIKAKEDVTYQRARTSLGRYERGQISFSKYASQENVTRAGKNFASTGRQASGDIVVTVKAKQKEGRGTRTRTITARFTGDNAKKFANNPSWWEVWYQYAVDAGDGDPNGLADLFEDADYGLYVA